MSRDSKTLLREQAKTNPKFKELLDSLENLSFDDIAKLDEARWVREGLKNIKMEEAEKLMQDYVNSAGTLIYNEDFQGDIQRWNAGDTWVRFGRTDILVKFGDLLFVTAKGIWLDTVFTSTPDKSMRLDCLTLVRKDSFSEYKKAVKEMIAKRHPEFKEADKPLFKIKRI